ncbi:PP2C family protein-serine/threonine phosphatase [Oribacterium sinus]|uniref:Serine/threonine-protein phosphatase n=1 Tax=Oribacterium sinus TaxID=237576 RepID=A0A930DPM1_9FIRM|nr:protein phosphatase 2C domain-containing protein [Oribacterium sinus]MBF1273249.1 serine/threonine-protein phosphatase [Oribacterium sinus]
MDFITMAVSSVGNVKEVNQDYYFFEQGRTERGNIVFAILCDGMGGLQQGEFASKTVVEAFKAWGKEHLADYAQGEFVDAEIRREWTELVNRCNQYLHAYGRDRGISLGTTLTVLLMTEERYYIMNIGDSRAYALEAGIRQLTRDHTVVQREVDLGKLSAYDAEKDSRRNILLQCIGASDQIYPDFFFGAPEPKATYLLCSDGFRHEVSGEELYQVLQRNRRESLEDLESALKILLRWNLERQERDNLTAIAISTI